MNEPVKIAFEIELDSRLIGLIECNFQEFQLDLCDLKTIKKIFHKLVNVLLFLLGIRVWEVREIHLITKKKILQVVLRHILDVHNEKIESEKDLKIYHQSEEDQQKIP